MDKCKLMEDGGYAAPDLLMLKIVEYPYDSEIKVGQKLLIKNLAEVASKMWGMIFCVRILVKKMWLF